MQILFIFLTFYLPNLNRIETNFPCQIRKIRFAESSEREIMKSFYVKKWISKENEMLQAVSLKKNRLLWKLSPARNYFKVDKLKRINTFKFVNGATIKTIY